MKAVKPFPVRYLPPAEIARYYPSECSAEQHAALVAELVAELAGQKA